MPPGVVETRYVVDVWLFPGPGRERHLGGFARQPRRSGQRQAWLGFSHTRMAIGAATAIAGVQDGKIIEPAATVVVDAVSVVYVTEIVLNLRGRRE